MNNNEMTIYYSNEHEYFMGDNLDKEFLNFKDGIMISKALPFQYNFKTREDYLKLNFIVGKKMMAYLGKIYTHSINIDKETLLSIAVQYNLRQENGFPISDLKDIVNTIFKTNDKTIELNTMVKTIYNPNYIGRREVIKRKTISNQNIGIHKINNTKRSILLIAKEWDYETYPKVTKRNIGLVGQERNIPNVNPRNMKYKGYKDILNQVIKELKETRTIDFNNYDVDMSETFTIKQLLDKQPAKLK